MQLESSLKKTVVLVGTLDTKGAEYAFLKDAIEKNGYHTITVDVGILNKPPFTPDVTRSEVARAGGGNITQLVRQKDRGKAVAVMSSGAASVLPKLYAEGKAHAVIALGGGGGTSIACSGMRALPLGVPKVMVSTLAGRDVSGLVGIKDIVMIPSIVDISGLNKISRNVLLQAAGAVCGMVDIEPETTEDRPIIAATMFGNTTPAVETSRKILENAGFEVIVFPCTGTSGMILEELVGSDYISGVLDITTTEWADELVGGVLAAGKTRLNAAARKGIPQVVVPGCLDMVNFWQPDTVPDKFKNRKFYPHNPDITLMRTNIEENRSLGKIIASKLNNSTGPVAVFIPLHGLSMIDAPGEPFWWPEADGALFHSIKEHIREDIPVTEMENNINDQEFAEACAACLLEMLHYG